MAITLTPAYLAELGKNVNRPNVIIEIAVDSGVKRFGLHAGRVESASVPCDADGAWLASGTIEAGGETGYAAGGFTGVVPCLKAVSSLQNKIDAKNGFTTRGQLTCVISGRDNWKGFIRDERLKNRRVTRRDGFVAPGFAYSDYAATFTGKVMDWSRKGDELTLVIGDEIFVKSSKKLPVENASKTQRLDYRNTHPVDVMTDILLNRLGIGAPYVDTGVFAFERDTWLPGWRFDRVLTEPASPDDYLNELQIETGSYVVHDGEKVSYKVFAPPVPGQAVEEWMDGRHILEDTFVCKSGYKENFVNRVVVYYDYDESGKDREENFEAAVIAVDTASQDASQWDETSTRTIKSKWIRTRTYTQPSSITGVTVYHVSKSNGIGTGYLYYNRANNSLQWTPPGGIVGDPVTLTKDGCYQVLGADMTRCARVIVVTAELAVSDKTEAVEITALAGEVFASTLAHKLINRYRDPASVVSFDVDMNNAAWQGRFLRPTDIKDITTGEAAEFGVDEWVKERVMLTSVRPDIAAGRISIEAVETRFYRRYGFIAQPGLPDYTAASGAQREYGYIGRAADNKVDTGAVDGYYAW